MLFCSDAKAGRAGNTAGNKPRPDFFKKDLLLKVMGINFVVKLVYKPQRRKYADCCLRQTRTLMTLIVMIRTDEGKLH